MKRSKQHIRNSAITAAIITVILFFIATGQKLAGFSKYRLYTAPKSVPEVVSELPMSVLMGIIIFLCLWLWESLKKEIHYVICPKCEETYIQEDLQLLKCTKCNSQLEDIDGFYEKHPELKK